MSDMSVKEAYKVIQAACGIEKGDRVRILRTWVKGEMGSCCTMFSSMEMIGFVGRTGKVDIYSDHITVENSEGLYVHVPFFCLELVEKAKPKSSPITIGGNEVKFFREGIPRVEVCGVSVHKETLQNILNRLEEQN